MKKPLRGLPIDVAAEIALREMIDSARDGPVDVEQPPRPRLPLEEIAVTARFSGPKDIVVDGTYTRAYIIYPYNDIERH